MLNQCRAISLSKEGTVYTEGVNYGNRLEWHRRPKGDVMALFETEPDVMVIYVPGQAGWASRWSTSYVPAHYLIFLIDESGITTGENGVTRYPVIRQLATIPVRRGARQGEEKAT